MPGAIILVATILCFVALLTIWFIRAKFLFYPKGKRVTVNLNSCKISTVFSYTVLQNKQLIAEAAIPALQAVIMAWQLVAQNKKVPASKFNTRDNLCILIKSNTDMAIIGKQWGFKTLSGFVSNIDTLLVNMPVINANANLLSDLRNYQYLLIHELLHIMLGDCNASADDHSNPNVWEAARLAANLPDKSVQKLAQMLLVTPNVLK